MKHNLEDKTQKMGFYIDCLTGNPKKLCHITYKSRGIRE